MDSEPVALIDTKLKTDRKKNNETSMPNLLATYGTNGYISSSVIPLKPASKSNLLLPKVVENKTPNRVARLSNINQEVFQSHVELSKIVSQIPAAIGTKRHSVASIKIEK
jgi:hypothetical protein